MKEKYGIFKKVLLDKSTVYILVHVRTRLQGDTSRIESDTFSYQYNWFLFTRFFLQIIFLVVSDFEKDGGFLTALRHRTRFNNNYTVKTLIIFTISIILVITGMIPFHFPVPRPDRELICQKNKINTIIGQ